MLFRYMHIYFPIQNKRGGGRKRQKQRETGRDRKRQAKTERDRERDSCYLSTPTYLDKCISILVNK